MRLMAGKAGEPFTAALKALALPKIRRLVPDVPSEFEIKLFGATARVAMTVPAESQQLVSGQSSRIPDLRTCPTRLPGRDRLHMAFSRPMTTLATHPEFVDLHLLLRGVRKRPRGVALEAVRDRVASPSNRVAQPHRLQQRLGADRLMSGRDVQRACGGIVAEGMLEIGLPVQSTDERNTVIPRPEGPFDRQLHDVLVVIRLHDQLVLALPVTEPIVRWALQWPVSNESIRKRMVGCGVESPCMAAPGLRLELARMTGAAGAGTQVSSVARHILSEQWILRVNEQQAGRCQAPTPEAAANSRPTLLIRQPCSTSESRRTDR